MQEDKSQEDKKIQRYEATFLGKLSGKTRLDLFDKQLI